MDVVKRGHFWVGCWEDLLRVESKTRNESYKVMNGAVCERCSVRWCSDVVEGSESDPSWQTQVDDVLAGWVIQIEHLSLLMTRVATVLQMLAESTSFDHVIDCLSVLNRLLQRQHRLLQRFEPHHVPAYNIEQIPNRCVYCGTEEGLV